HEHVLGDGAAGVDAEQAVDVNLARLVDGAVAERLDPALGGVGAQGGDDAEAAAGAGVVGGLDEDAPEGGGGVVGVAVEGGGEEVGVAEQNRGVVDPGLGVGAGLDGAGVTVTGLVLGHHQLAVLVGGQGQQDDDDQNGQKDQALARRTAGGGAHHGLP